MRAATRNYGAVAVLRAGARDSQSRRDPFAIQHHRIESRGSVERLRPALCARGWMDRTSHELGGGFPDDRSAAKTAPRQLGCCKPAAMTVLNARE
jgi:hypothetical protein